MRTDLNSINKSNGIFSDVLLHVLVWLCWSGVILFQSYSRTGSIDFFSIFSPSFFINISLFYLNYYFLVPKLLLKKKIIPYLFVSLIVILVVNYIMERTLPPDIMFNREEVRGLPPAIDRRFNFPRDEWFRFKMFLGPAIGAAFYFVVGTIIRVYIEWNNNERLREKTETEKVNSELQFLKTQLNPHFLFNSLNAVYTLSIKKSPDTSEAIISLSELMRYMIYEANKEIVSLDKELDYIKSYIQLQRLRLPNAEEVYFNIYGDEREKTIKPLLFISFIENAFKYGTDYRGNTWIKINISIDEDKIHLFVRNKIGIVKKSPESSGIGLENIQNRLKLLYPGAHRLDMQNDGKYYTINLTILNIQGDEMHNNRR
ncbi:sensor histidine kinase [Joostella sp.]|uniref:sensor histidine kinase n=1 Tax=Joostella sp. TaxID=2231138 RepID=UPI003A8DD58A